MTDVKIYAVAAEQALIDHVEQFAASDAFVGSKIRVMPDGHDGKGCVVGTTATYLDKICPNTVGVDIACRVSAFEIPRDVDLKKLDKVITRYVPAGFNIHNDVMCDFNYGDFRCWDSFDESTRNRIVLSLGTLGGGNHFISVEGNDDHDYLIVHCGSRSLGTSVCAFYQNLAVEHCDGLGIPKDLCYLDSDFYMDDYLNDMRLCNDWTLLNHMTIYNIIADHMGWEKI